VIVSFKAPVLETERVGLRLMSGDRLRFIALDRRQTFADAQGDIATHEGLNFEVRISN
jgi:hypothetical protein